MIFFLAVMLTFACGLEGAIGGLSALFSSPLENVWDLRLWYSAAAQVDRPDIAI